MKKFKFVTGERFTVYSNWHECIVTYEPVYFVDGEGKKRFLFSPAVDGEKAPDGKMNWQLSASIEDGRNKHKNFKRQLMENDGRWIDAYATWGYHPEKTKGMDPLQFIAWVKEKKYTFVKSTSSVCIEEDKVVFSGKLNEYSHAFRFHIYDKELAEKVIKESGVEVIHNNNE